MSTRRPSWKRKREDDHDQEEKEEESALTILKDFCEDTSWGGLGRVAGSNYLFFRVVWMLAFLGALGAGIFQLIGLFATYESRPINTRISLQHSSSLAFPSVTLCNFNILRKSHLHELPSSVRGDIEKFAKKEHSSSSPKNTKKKTKSDQEEEDDDGFPDPAIADVDYQNAEKIAAALMKEDPSVLEGIGHQFETMVQECKFRGVDCSYMNTSSPTTDWTTFWHYKFGNCFIFNPESIKGSRRKGMRLSKPGPSLGLTLQIYVEQNEYIDQVTQDAGAVLHISPRGDMPFPYEEGISLAPGFSTSLGMRLIQISRQDRFKNNSCVSESKADNRNLYANKFNTSYSTMACIQSCIATSQKAQCGCMEYKYYPKDKIVCDTFNTTTVACLRTVNRLAKNNKLNCSKSCPPPCKQQVYRSMSSFSSWPSSNFMDVVSEELNISSSTLRNNLLKVSIYFQDLNYELIEEEISYKLENFVSDIGGQLGLWLGVSVLSGLEVIELIILLWLHFCCKNEKRQGNIGNGNDENTRPTNSFVMT